jgi:MoxR-like ATPase
LTIAATARACPPTLGGVDGDIAEVVDAMVKNIDGVVKGKHHEIRMAMCCMLTEGHLLLDDVPGTGKTTLAKAIAGSIAGTWKRVQFTPDLLPSDITGVMVYEQATGNFRFREGPV